MTNLIDDRLVAARVAGMSLRDSAAVCSVSVSTVKRRLRDETLRKRIDAGLAEQARKEADERSELRQLALRTLRNVMTEAENQQVAVRAALGALQAVERLDFMHEFASRQAAINEAIMRRLAAEGDDDEVDGAHR